MRFEIDIDKLIDEGITIQQYLLCQFIYQQESKLLNFYIEQFNKFVTKEDFDSLINKGFVDLHNKDKSYIFTNSFVTNRFINKFIEKPKKSKLSEIDVDDWIDDWYNLFPKGIKSGGYLVRSDKQGCFTKMKKFIKRYPQFNKDIILKATADYVEYFRMKGWNYMSLAHFFIFKNDVSMLAGYCENILDKIESGKEVNLEVSSDRFNQEESDWGGGMTRL